METRTTFFFYWRETEFFGFRRVRPAEKFGPPRRNSTAQVNNTAIARGRHSVIVFLLIGTIERARRRRRRRPRRHRTVSDTVFAQNGTRRRNIMNVRRAGAITISDVKK